jgi:OTU domain-containing protein 6
MASPETATMGESLEQMQARHRKEQRDLQSRITNKKKNATKKTRKFINDECAELERQLKERQEGELRTLTGEADEEAGADEPEDVHQPPEPAEDTTTTTTNAAAALASQLQSTTLSASPSPSSSPDLQRQEQQQQQQQPHPQQQQQQQQQQEQQPRQKRNRQKERLARRAAEAAAAQAAAASEAAAMPDRRAQEQAAMQRAFAAHALREHPIAPDGHCLFAAVADQLAVNGLPLLPLAVGGSDDDDDGLGQDGYADERGKGNAGGGGGAAVEDGLRPRVQPYKVVRRAAAGWIEAHRAEYEPFLEEPVEGYVARIRDTAEWGGQLELSALANAYGVEIRVVQGAGRVEVIKPAAGGDSGSGDGKGEGTKTLWLAYYRHGYGLGEHYNSLRKAE